MTVVLSQMPYITENDISKAYKTDCQQCLFVGGFPHKGKMMRAFSTETLQNITWLLFRENEPNESEH